MDDGTPGLILYGAIIRATAIFSVSFSVAWFVIYTTVGSWLKVRLIHLRLTPSIDVPKRYGPTIVSHILFSVLFVNPFILLYILCGLGTKVIISGTEWLVIAILYFWFLPLGTECLLLRVLPRWSRLKWLRYQPPLKRLILANLAVSFLVFGVAFAAGVICARIF